MISIKKLLSTTPSAPSTAQLRSTTLLLEGIALHAADCDSEEKSKFQSSIRAIRREVESMTASDDILIAIGGAIQMLEAYNRGIEKSIRIRGKEFQEVVGMFSKTLIEISNAGESAVENLHGIEKDLHSISQIDDLREVKTKLGQSLKALAEETARQKHSSVQMAGSLGEKLSIAKASLRPKPSEIDPITGLPGHAAATREMADLMAEGETRYVAVLCVERLDLINTRFGFSVGDQILMMFSQFVAQQLTGNDKLYRWRGPGVVAILERRGGRAEVQSELRHTTSSRLEHSVTMGSRDVLLPISMSWSVLSFDEARSPDDLFSKIDAFVASQGTKI